MGFKDLHRVGVEIFRDDSDVIRLVRKGRQVQEGIRIGVAYMYCFY